MRDKNVSTLMITRGLPGSGKTTFACSWLAQDPENRMRVNRDDLRMMTYGVYAGLSRAQEDALTVTQHAQVRVLLESGKDVIVDDTLLRLKHARAFADIAKSVGAEFIVKDFTSVSVETCIARDLARERMVGEDVIRGMAKRYRFPLPKVKPTPRQSDDPPERYVPDTSAFPSVIVDLDGTLARNVTGREMTGDGQKYVYDDEVNQNVQSFVQGCLIMGHDVIFMSGRNEFARSETERWLREKAGIDDHEYELFMRANDDSRKDYIVKGELFDKYVRPYYRNVRLCIDDRKQIVDLWRGMGLECWAVSEGNF